MSFPKLSIAAKLYAIFALMAATTVLLAGVAILEARHHAALTDEFESANAGTLNVEKVNGLIYAVVMESRGVYMSADLKVSKVYADGIRVFNKQIAKVVEDWRKSVRGDDAQLFSHFPIASVCSSISAKSLPVSAPKFPPPPDANGAITMPIARYARR